MIWRRGATCMTWFPPSEMTTAHLVVSLLKRWLLGTHQGPVKAQHPGHYLDAFTPRFSRRKSGSRGRLFSRLLQQAPQTASVTGASVAGKDWLGDDGQAPPIGGSGELEL